MSLPLVQFEGQGPMGWSLSRGFVPLLEQKIAKLMGDVMI
jgi:hypothetical protein